MADKYNADTLKKMGVDVWHELGYDGSYGITATGEKPFINALTKDWWEDPLGWGAYGEGSEHSFNTAMVFHTFAPKRKLVSLPPDNVNREGGFKFTKDAIPYIMRSGVDSMFSSQFGDPDGMDSAISISPYLCYINSAGNNRDSYNPMTRAEYVWGAGAISITREMPTTYSATSPYVDFGLPAGIWVINMSGTTYGPFNGTSCAAPVLAGVVACVNDFFIKKTGKPLTRAKMYEFLKDNSKDIWDEGKDNRTGWGLPILPHPDTVEIEKYATKGGDDYDMKFPDTKGHWAEKTIDEITDLGLMNGYPSGNFKPDQFMTRAEVATVMKKALEFIGKDR